MDPFNALKGFHAPSTLLGRLEMGAIVQANIRQILIDALQDAMGHALVVAHGRFHFRTLLSKQLGGYFDGNRAQLDHLADVAFTFLETRWHKAHPDVSPTKFLDSINEKSAPTEREIDEAWELEIAGDERAMRQMYEGSARTRKGSDLGVKPH